MKKIITLVCFVFITSLILVSCSELENNITSVTKPSVHGEGALNINSPNFHGNYFDKMKFRDCQNCHAKNFQGGLTPVNCGDVNCHPAIKIHADSSGVMNPNSSNFHGRYLLKNPFIDCQQCHGGNFAGGTNSPSCVTCHSSIAIHQAGLVDTASAGFHGKNPLSKQFTSCQQCHGANFAGGISSPSCVTCHSAINVHKDGIQDTTSANFHGKYPLPNGLSDCRGCHGQNFTGGYNSPSCVTCHSSITVHKAGIIDTASANFHGKNPLSGNFSNCQQCHGENFTGGNLSPSCATCHSAIKVHKIGIVDPGSPNFHGKYPLANGLSDCRQCHGQNLTGGNLSPTCATCHSAIIVHKPGIIDPSSPDFHGKNSLTGNFSNCQQCHGENFSGGNLSPSCATCHSAIKVHKTGIIDPGSPNFHGKYQLPNGLSDCSQCHGQNFNGGNLSPTCVTCHSAISVHKPGILNPSSPEFHGRYQLTNGFTNCQQCHGENFAGGTISPSCATCHSTINVHKAGILDPSSADFHGKYIANNNWNLPNCKQCHGTNYGGGLISTSCLSCHNQPSGPEACNTCHGNFSDPDRIAPPRDLSGNTFTTARGVGAHEKHLYTNEIGKTVECSTCHTVPQALNSTGHLDGSMPAEVYLKGLAIFNVAGNASYSSSTLTCANTYCHGNFEFYKDSTSVNNHFAYSGTKMEGNKHSVIWNRVDGSQAPCGSCHGLPPAGHVDFGGLSTCANCHYGIVNTQGQIIDKTKHMNGIKNVFGN